MDEIDRPFRPSQGWNLIFTYPAGLRNPKLPSQNLETGPPLGVLSRQRPSLFTAYRPPYASYSPHCPDCPTDIYSWISFFMQLALWPWCEQELTCPWCECVSGTKGVHRDPIVAAVAPQRPREGEGGGWRWRGKSDLEIITCASSIIK